MNLLWLVFGGSALALLGLFNWRRAVIGALLLVVFEGAIRKWVLPQASQMIYFAKDLVLIGAYLGYFWNETARRPVRFGEGLSLALTASLVWAFFQSLNPGTGSLLAGLFGWRAYAIYVPLCFIVPALFRTADELER